MKVGITGTRKGMNEYQRENIELFLKSIQIDEFHHGDCVGVDEEVAKMVNSWIICHPPINEDLRAFYPSNEYREKLSYFHRNRNIVDEVDLLLVVPYQNQHGSKGGTWYTYDYAIGMNVEIIVFLPNGGIIRKPVREKSSLF